jgi:hypothetical protein
MVFCLKHAQSGAVHFIICVTIRFIDGKQTSYNSEFYFQMPSHIGKDR